MKIRLLVIGLALLFFTNCDKNKKTKAPETTTSHSNRLKNIRTVFNDKYIMNLTSIYSTGGQLLRTLQNDSIFKDSAWVVEKFTASEFHYTNFNKFERIVLGNTEIRYVYDNSNKLRFEIHSDSELMTVDTLKFNGNNTIAIMSTNNFYTKYFYTQNLDSIVNYDLNGSWSSKTLYEYSKKEDLSLQHSNQFFSLPYKKQELIRYSFIPDRNGSPTQSWKSARIYDPMNFPVMETTTYEPTGKIVETKYFTYY